MGWVGIARLGLVQAALGALAVLVTSTMNRVMVVEWHLPALLPGALVALHYGVQVLRPGFGHQSDRGGRRTPWIVGGMAALCAGAVGASLCVAAIGAHPALAIAGAVAAYLLVGAGVGACGTSLLVLLSAQVRPERRAPAATIVWTMMIFGIALAATGAGRALDPFSPGRLVTVTAVIAAAAMAATLLAVWRVERAPAAVPAMARAGFGAALRDVWQDDRARGFAVFVFVSMLAYSAQELLIEPFAGRVFGLAPGQSTAMVGVQHAGVLVGMVAVAVLGAVFGRSPVLLRVLTMSGCVGSAGCIVLLAAGGAVGPGWPLRAGLFALGVANGAFAVSAIGAMMGLAHERGGARAGVRMGVWGAAQAVAFGLGGLLGAGASDAAAGLLGDPARAYAAVFVVEAALFLFAARQAARVFGSAPAMRGMQMQAGD